MVWYYIPWTNFDLYATTLCGQMADLEEIAANRDAVIDEIVAMWPAEPGAEGDLRAILSQADDEDLLVILNADTFDDVITTLGGEDLLEVRTDRDYVFTPVTPCKIGDTRAAGPGKIIAGTSRLWRVWGNAAQMADQGGNPAGCRSLRGEPRGAMLNLVAIDPDGKGNLKAYPIGATTGLSVNFASIGTNLANAGAIKTSYNHASGRDIRVAASYANVHASIQVLGYFHELNGEDIAASDSSGTLQAHLTVTTNYTTLASKTVSVPVNGRVVIMGEASWANGGESDYLNCEFRENSVRVDSWNWEPGDRNHLDMHQTRFYHKTVTAGNKTYDLRCSRRGGTATVVTAAYQNLTVMFFEEDL